MTFFSSLPADPSSKQRNAAQRELAASIGQIYSYGKRKPFNISQLQTEADKRHSIQGYSDREHQKKHEATVLTAQMRESFYSGHKDSLDPTGEITQTLNQTLQQPT